MHKPVLLREVVEHLGIRAGGVYVDGTLGGGSHAGAILGQAGPAARVVGIDRDAGALERARAHLGPLASQVFFEHGGFADMMALSERHGCTAVDGVLLDLGFSSDQVDDPDRGLSFMVDGPLDMRLDRSQRTTAAELVNGLPEQELADLIWRYGDEPASRRIAAAIGARRRVAPLQRTLELAELVSHVKGGRRGSRIHPATQTFQALRIATNDELGQVERGVEAAIRLVRVGGRVAVISFHSGEDGLVKRIMAAHVGREVSLPQGGVRWEGAAPPAKWIVKRPLCASEAEAAENPRSRSAKLRVMERVGP